MAIPTAHLSVLESDEPCLSANERLISLNCFSKQENPTDTFRWRKSIKLIVVRSDRFRSSSQIFAMLSTSSNGDLALFKFSSICRKEPVTTDFYKA